VAIFFYSSIYAAIGSAVDNIQDASQLQSLALAPIMLGLILSMTVVDRPELNPGNLGFNNTIHITADNDGTTTIWGACHRNSGIACVALRINIVDGLV